MKCPECNNTEYLLSRTNDKAHETCLVFWGASWFRNLNSVCLACIQLEKAGYGHPTSLAELERKFPLLAFASFADDFPPAPPPETDGGNSGSGGSSGAGGGPNDSFT